VLSSRATRGLEGALFLVLVSPLLREWAETASGSSRLSYALLVPALALVLALRARRDGPATEAREPGAPGSTALAGGLALAAAATLATGTLSGIFTLSLLALPLAAAAFVARAGGAAALRRHSPALVFSLAMVPPPMPVMDRVNPWLVEASGATAVALLKPFDPAVTWLGSTLHFRGWNLIVAEACSGSGTFLTLTVLCAFLVALFRVRLGAGLVLIALAVPLTLLLNGLRIASSSLLIARFGAQAGEGLAHELLGQAVVVAGAIGLALCVARFGARPPRVEAVA
jgi:exosortase